MLKALRPACYSQTWPGTYMVDKSSQLFRRLVPDELWALAEPLIPRLTARPQGDGTAPADDQVVFTAIVFVLTSGCAWRQLPPSFGVTVPTVHRRFTEWTKAALWPRLHHAARDQLSNRDLIDWSRAVAHAASVRAKVRTHDRTEPVDRTANPQAGV